MIRSSSESNLDALWATVLHSTVLALSLALISSTPLFAADAAAPQGEPEEIVITGSRIDVGLTGASTTVIDREAIAYSPAQTLPELLQFEAGVQSVDLYGGTGAARATADLRGFGSTGTQNALLLVNGRRLNNIDLAHIDYASIPRDSIDRIEITRGNAASVLYGEGAVGGVINIVTRTGAPDGNTSSARLTMGPEHYVQGDFATELALDEYSLNAYGTLISGDGYRDNNEIRQRNLVSELRRHGDAGDVFLKFGIDDQELGLPGGRLVEPNGKNELDHDPRGAATPFDWADQNGFATTLGATQLLGDGLQLVFDAGLRFKNQKSMFYSPGFNNFVDTDLWNLSVTPRLKLEREIAGFDVRTLTGIDYYRASYDSDRSQEEYTAAVHSYDAEQWTLALYAQNTMALGDDTDLSLGLRGQYLGFHGEDGLNPAAPGWWGESADDSLRSGEWQHAFNLGIEHRLSEQLSVFGRVGRSFRFPTIDERIGGRGKTSMKLETQISADAEIGASYQGRSFDLRTSIYAMNLRDELYYRADDFSNHNLDPTRRFGVESSGGLQLRPDLRLTGALAYTWAEFVDGPLDDKDVPLVALWTGTLSAFWDIHPLVGDLLDELELVTTVSYSDEKRLIDDTYGIQSDRIPEHTLVDLKLSGARGPISFALTVINLFDRDYYEYGVASYFTPGRYSAYPLPGRSLMFSIGAEL
jgi:iron complex outermembrane receptor protein